MRKFSIKKAVAVGAGAVIVASGAGVAFAYWTSTGDGSGSATTGADTKYTVTVDANALANLTPGGPVDTINFSVLNTSTGHQKVTAATAAVENLNGSAWTAAPGCSAADFSITETSITAADLAQGDSTTGSFKIQMVNNPTASQDGCKNVSVPLHVHVS